MEGVFVVALLPSLFPVRLKLEVEGVGMIFFTSLPWAVTFPPAQVGVPVFGDLPCHGTSHPLQLPPTGCCGGFSVKALE